MDPNTNKTCYFKNVILDDAREEYLVVKRISINIPQGDVKNQSVNDKNVTNVAKTTFPKD